MIRTILILLITLYFQKIYAQTINDFVGHEWKFNFLMIPGETKSITTNYPATYFEITSDSTFTMGISEAVEEGTLKVDSTLSIILYNYNSDKESKKWANSFKIYYCSKDYLILVRKGVSFNGLINNYKGFGDIWYVYSKFEIAWDKDAKKLYKKLKKEILK